MNGVRTANDVLMVADLIPMTVVSTRPLTPTVREFVLRRVDGEPYSFTSGQHLMVWHNNLYREFSIASSPRDPSSIRLAVRTVGAVSAWLHTRAVGDVIAVTEPMGLEFHPKYLAGRDLWLIAGGIGLTGLVSTVLELEANPTHFGTNHRLFYGLPNRNELLWPEELERWRSVLTIDITGDGRHLIGDLLHPDFANLPRRQAGASSGKFWPIDNVTALICGSARFHAAVFQVLQKLGIQRQYILTNIWE